MEILLGASFGATTHRRSSSQLSSLYSSSSLRSMLSSPLDDTNRLSENIKYKDEPEDLLMNKYDLGHSLMTSVAPVLVKNSLHHLNYMEWDINKYADAVDYYQFSHNNQTNNTDN